MRIVSCYVENFGKLNKFTYHFKEGLNVIEEDNGWGKSTLAAFIKAMFYGLEYHRGKKLTDRKLYSPWNENKFGGYLIFEKDGIEYKIERFFGRTPKYDTVRVYNSSRNTETDELGDNPGEAIWEVDRDSYEKTAFISLDDSNLLNDIISSKLGEIEDGEADLETSTRAIEILDKEITRIRARRGRGGLIGNKESKLSQLKEELRQYKNSLEKIDQTEDWIEKEEERLEEINREISKIEKEQSKLLLYEKKDQYINIKADLEIKEEEYIRRNKFFKEKSLSEEELNTIKDQAGKYSNGKEQAAKNKLSDEEKRKLEELKSIFKENIPKLEEIDDYNERIKELSNKTIELEKYKLSNEDRSKFNILDRKYKDLKINSRTIDGYLEDLNRVTQLAQEENEVKNELTRLKEEKTNSKKDRPRRVPKLSTGLIILILGIILIAISPVLGAISIILGSYEIVASFIYKGKVEKEDKNKETYIEIERFEKKLRDLEDEKQELAAGYMSFIDSMDENQTNIGAFLANSKFDLAEYERLKNHIEKNLIKKNQLKNEIFNLKLEIENFLKRYYDSPEEKDYGRSLAELRNNLYRFQDLSRAEDSYRETRKLVESSKKILEEKLDYYFEEFPNDIKSAMEDLTKKYYDLEKWKNRLEEARASKEKFESKNNISQLEDLDISEKKSNEISDSLIEEKKELNASKSELIKIIERHKKDIHSLVQEADRIEDIESEITQLEIDIKDLEDQHRLLNISKEAMLEAKENLAEKYMGDMSSNFRKYIEKLNNKKAEQYHLDINLDVKVEHGGELYKGEQLSRGMKDLVQLCLRMALVESVYKDVDNPILILDDPFINLDDDRLENAIDLLREVSLDYQVIYFICHSSRNLGAIS